MNSTIETSKSEGLVRYQADLGDDIVEFQKKAYPDRRPEWIAPRWNWMFIQSAMRLGVDPMVWIYRKEAQVKAHQGAIAVALQVNDARHVTGWFVETMALESVRGKTIGPAVVMKAKQELPFNLSLGQTASMRQLQFRMGWEQIAPLEVSLLAIRPWKILFHKLRSRWVSKLLGLAISARQEFRRFRAGHSTQGVTSERVGHFGQRHDVLWNRVSEKYRCAVVRDASYLNWKYVEQPGQDFIRLELSHAGDVVAIAVVVVREPDDVYSYRRAFLVDVVVDPTNRGLVYATFDAVKQLCRDQQADALIFQFINPHFKEHVAAYGFLRRSPTRYFLVSPDTLSDDERQQVLDADNWLITMGDSDIDRPW